MDALYNAAKPRVVAIGGPTATGKTALSVALAKRFGGEIISADSMQIYQGLDVGTAKVTPEEMQGVPHHLVGFLAPEQAFSVADFTTLAGKTITQLTAQGKLPLVVGGTGLYITSLLNGIGFTPEKVDPAIRQELQARLQAEGSQALYAELAAVDPGYAAKVHPNNTPRVIRALELYRATGRKMSAEREAARPAEKPYRSLCLCLTCRDRTLLYQRIDTRCDRMMQSGILEEAKLVYDHRDTYRTAAQAIGYLAELLQEVVLHLVGLGQLRPQGKGEIITDLPLHLVVVSQDLRASALHLSHRVGYHSLVAHHTQSILVHRDSIGRGV